VYKVEHYIFITLPNLLFFSQEGISAQFHEALVVVCAMHVFGERLTVTEEKI
jgi:hypothetical protein